MELLTKDLGFIGKKNTINSVSIDNNIGKGKSWADFWEKLFQSENTVRSEFLAKSK